MIDKTDLRVSEFAQPGPVLTEVIAQLKKGHPVPPFRPSRLYQHSADLRDDFGIDALVHMYCRFGRPNHKIEIIDAGDKTLEQMAEIIAMLFDVDPWSLSLMRVDLAADVSGVPVPWFQQHAVFNRKQFSSRFQNSTEQELQFVAMGSVLAQTIYAGKRPDLMRIYNKLAELYRHWKRTENDCRRFNKQLEEMDLTEEQKHYGRRFVPTFQEFCKAHGYEHQEGNIITRIEHQFGGTRVPKELATLNDLRFAHEFDPFTGFKLVGMEPIPNLDYVPEDVSVRDWLAALGLNALTIALGSAHLAHSLVRRNAKGNGKRILESLEKCAPGVRQPLTMEEVRDSFRMSTLAQAPVPGPSGVHLSPTYDDEKQFA